MAAQPRVIMHNGKRLPDFDPSMDIEDIKKFYAGKDPTLTTAGTIVTGVRGETKDYEFKTSVGKKG